MNQNKLMQSEVAFYGMFVSLALVVSYIESLIPIPMPVIGMKLGLANIVIVWILYSLGTKPAIGINIMRILLVGFLFGNLYSIIFSSAGAILSFFAMVIAKKTKRFSIIGVSIIGSVAHNLGQIIVAILILDNIHIALYYPYLMVSGVITGIIIGILGGILFKKIKILQTNVHL